MGHTQRVAIIGAGQQGEVVWDCLTAAGHEVVGFVDDVVRRPRVGLPVVGDLDDLPPVDGVVVAIGSNAARRAVILRLLARGVSLLNAIHPTASIASNAQIGRGVTILAGAVVSTGTVIGDGTILDVQSVVGHHSTVGGYVHLAHAGVSSRCTVGEGAFLGIGCHVLPDLSVGAWAQCVGEAYVTKAVPDHATVCGRPARLVAH